MLSSKATHVNTKLPAAFLTLCLCGASLAPALDEPAVAPTKNAAPNAAANDAGLRAAADTVAAIEALGANPATKKISAIVYKAVRSSPENVLPVVSAAAGVSPQAAVAEIVTAAVAAVPNPWKQVIYRRLAALDLKKNASDFKGGPGGRQLRDGAENADPGGGAARGSSGRAAADPAGGIQMTLAEAIARAAFDAQQGLSLSKLQDAVDVALRTDPETLMRRIQSPRAVSGVGDAGTSNYANEPLRTPQQPVVSR